MTTTPEIALKIIILGNSGVGKTVLFNAFRYNGKPPPGDPRSTIGADFAIRRRSLVANNKAYDVTVQVWDTAGQERFKSVTKSFIRGAHAILFVFDAPETAYEQQFANFRALSEWYQYACAGLTDQGHEFTPRDCVSFALCMSKKDRLGRDPMIEKQINTQAKEFLAERFTSEVDVKRLYSTTSEDPSTILTMFDHLIQHVFIQQVRIYGSAERLAKDLQNKPALALEPSRNQLRVAPSLQRLSVRVSSQTPVPRDLQEQADKDEQGGGGSCCGSS